jgi:hypothetical protein
MKAPRSRKLRLPLESSARPQDDVVEIRNVIQQRCSIATVILSGAKDLRRYFGLNCHGVVFNDNIGDNQESASREIDVPEVLRYAQDDSLILIIHFDIAHSLARQPKRRHRGLR